MRKNSVKRCVWLLLLYMAVVASHAQIMNPVHFSAELKLLDQATAEIVFSATIDEGWHVYSTDASQELPVNATFTAVKLEGAELVGKLKPRGDLKEQYDPIFDSTLRFFEHKAVFAQQIRFTQPQYDIDCYLEYYTCSSKNCLPPSQVQFTQQGKSPAVDLPTPVKAQEKATAEAEQSKAEATPSVQDATDSIATIEPTETADLWQPVIDELRTMGNGSDIAHRSLLYILLMGFIGGLLAVCMPCIWPIIPMTVSFFLKQSKSDKTAAGNSRQKGIRGAVNYGLSIIVIYLALGLLVTAIFGSDALNAMSTHAVFNIFLFLLLIVFALSFFGWFEIRLPGKWADAIDTKAANASGLLSVFLMAFTLVLVSFSCTAPIIGLLLVETATSGNWMAPAVGMFGFALALALPFTLFALFPSWLKQAPKSGSWMNILKVTLGFIELAFALKFFSVADLAYHWHLLDREVFLSLWIAIFGLLGLYLIGLLRFQSDAENGDAGKPRPVLSIMGGLLSLAFAIYLIPGLWGAPCKAVSAFAPPMSTQDFNLNTKTVEARFTDYEAGMAAAKAEGKPVFIDFTGYGCVNCRKMEAAVWTDPRIAEMLTDDYVLISLYVDDKTPLTEPVEVTDGQGHTKTLSTVGAKWSYLQSHKFGANTQPFYVLLDPKTARPLNGMRSYDEDIDEYIRFLETGLKNYK